MLPVLFPSLWFSFAPHLLVHAWKRKEEGVERISLCGCVPLCLSPCGSFCWCASVCVLTGWTSALCPGARAVTQWIPWRQEHCFSLANSRVGQRTGDTTRREVQTSMGLKAHVHMHPSEHTLKKMPSLWDKQTAHALMSWIRQHTAWANYHLSMKLSGEEQACACVFVSECQAHHCVFARCWLFLCCSRTPTFVSTLPLPLNPQRPKCEKGSVISLSIFPQRWSHGRLPW